MESKESNFNFSNDKLWRNTLDEDTYEFSNTQPSIKEKNSEELKKTDVIIILIFIERSKD